MTCFVIKKSSYASLRESIEEGKMDESFLDLVSKCQSRRLDDQRSDLPKPLPPIDRTSGISQASKEEDDLFETVLRLQGSRIDEQRCALPPASNLTTPSQHRWEEECVSKDELFELIFASQSSRINDQRSPDPKTITTARKSNTIPSEDFFNLIQHLQSTRIEDQRSPLPVLAN